MPATISAKAPNPNAASNAGMVDYLARLIIDHNRNRPSTPASTTRIDDTVALPEVISVEVLCKR